MKWLILFLGVASNASASVLVKFAMMPPRKFPSFNEPMAALSNWPFWLGLGLYGAAFLLYAAALARLHLMWHIPFSRPARWQRWHYALC